MGTFIENSVSLDEIAKAVKSTVDGVKAEASEYQMFIGEDWAGRAAISEIDAHRLVSGTARRDADHQAAWQAHQARTAEWEAARQKVHSAASDEARMAALSRGVGAGAAQAEAQDVAREAVERYERGNPMPEFNGEPTAKNWFARAAELVKGGAR